LVIDVKKSLSFGLCCQDPFRLFFPIGLLCQFIGVSHWAFYYWGWLDSYSGYYHAFVQIQLYETAFVVGFLGMALPRFWESAGPRGGEVIAGLALLLLALLAALLEQWTLARVAYFVLLLLFSAFLILRFLRREDNLPPVFSLIALGLFAGITGAAMAIWPLSPWVGFGEALLTQGMLLMLLWAVSGYLAPRLLYGERDEAQTVGSAARRQRAVLLLFGLSVLGSFCIEMAWSMQWGRLLRAALLSGYLLTKGFYRLPHRRHAPLYALFFALWCAPLGTLLSALWTAGQMGALHVIFLGSFGLATTVIASRVISAHCDAEEEWSGGGSRLGLVFLLLVLALLLRLGAEVLPLYYFAFLHASALLWMGGQGLWALRFIPLLRRVE
jgi:uncharacterized protein involved in response to NO